MQELRGKVSDQYDYPCRCKLKSPIITMN